MRQTYQNTNVPFYPTSIGSKREITSKDGSKTGFPTKGSFVTHFDIKKALKINLENKENHANYNNLLTSKNEKNDHVFLKSNAFKNSITHKVNSGYANLHESFKLPPNTQSINNSSTKIMKETTTKFQFNKNFLGCFKDSAKPMTPQIDLQKQSTLKIFPVQPDHLKQYIPGILSHYKINLYKNKVEPNSIKDNWKMKNLQKIKTFETIFNLCTYFGLKSRTFFTANNIFDRYYHFSDDHKNESMTLMAIASFFLAAKFEEIYPPSISDVCKILNHKFSAEGIFEMEGKILLVLQFNMIYVSPLDTMELIANQWELKCNESLQMAIFVLSLYCFDHSIDLHDPFKLAIFSLSISTRIVRDQFLFRADAALSSEENYFYLKNTKKIIANIEVQKLTCFDAFHSAKLENLKKFVCEKISN